VAAVTVAAPGRAPGGTVSDQAVNTDRPGRPREGGRRPRGRPSRPAGRDRVVDAWRTGPVEPLVKVVVTGRVDPASAIVGAVTAVKRGPVVRSTRKVPESGRFREESADPHGVGARAQRPRVRVGVPVRGVPAVITKLTRLRLVRPQIEPSGSP